MIAMFAVCGGLLFISQKLDEGYVEAALESNGIVQTHIGTDIEADEDTSWQAMNNFYTPYYVTGPRGEGTVYCYSSFHDEDLDGVEIEFGMLKLSSGKTFDLNTGIEIDGEDIDAAMTALADQAGFEIVEQGFANNESEQDSKDVNLDSFIGEGVPKDPVKAFEWYQKAAEQGDAEAEIRLARMYMHGVGVSKDVAKGMDLITKAAEQGDVKAQYNLGAIYEDGKDGVPKDPVKAFEWYRKAAERGLDVAQFNLALMYSDGEDMPKDLVQAHMWFNLAAASATADGASGAFGPQGMPIQLIEFSVMDLEPQMTKEQIAEAEKLAREWIRAHPKLEK